MPTNEMQPYVGPRAFSEADRGRFFGRDYETNELTSLVVAHSAVLVYAASGAGKTSLLRAGLVPRLRTEGFDVLPIAVVGGADPPGIDIASVPNAFVFKVLLGWANEPVDKHGLAEMTLAGYLAARTRTQEVARPSIPRAIVFDQFEELFTSHPELWRNRMGFFGQLRDALQADRLLRVVLVVREDYVAWLDRYAALLPEELAIRFRLEFLDRPAALEAIQGPLRTTTRSFADGVAESLVEELGRIRVGTDTGETREAPGEFVEPVLLQLVCQRLWQELPSAVTEIAQEHIKAFGDVDQTLARFYERCLKETVAKTGVAEADLRGWFEHELITPAATRATVFYGPEKAGSISHRAAEALVDQHIVRSEYRAGARWCELAHDRLIKPIKDSNMQCGLSQTPTVNLREAYAAISRVYGLAYEYQRLVCAVHDNGSATVTRACKLVAFSKASEFVIYMLLPEKKGRTSDARSDFLVRTPEGTTLRIRPPEPQAGKYARRVQIEPPLEVGQSVEFELTEQILQRVFQTPGNVGFTPTTPYDYFAWDIYHPTARLELRVELPPGLQCTRVEPDVWYAMSQSTFRHEDEYNRVRPKLATGIAPAQFITLQVDHPIFSLSYVVKWWPVTQGAGSIRAHPSGSNRHPIKTG